MSSSYKPAGPFKTCRTFRRWVASFPDGEELIIPRKSDAFRYVKAFFPGTVTLYEETVARYRPRDVFSKDLTSRIDITNQALR